jgi:transposase
MEKVIEYPQIVETGCGLDVHKDIIVGTVSRGNQRFETREFGADTSSLTSLRDWCKQAGVTHVAMESTGIYWKPVFNILEEDFEILLVNARHVKNVPGHKTDKKDSVWLSKLLLSGLLKASFIPPQDIRELRDMVRYKKKLVGQIASEKNRIIKVLEDCNIKLSSVLSSVDGSVGTRIIDAIIFGERDVDILMGFYHGKIKASKEEFRKALTGRITPHHIRMLQFHKKHIEDTEWLIKDIDKEIDKAAEAYKIEIDLLQTIDGIGKESAIAVISEVGVDMSKFPNEHHLASWAGVSPGNNESGGKKKTPKP